MSFAKVCVHIPLFFLKMKGGKNEHLSAFSSASQVSGKILLE